MVLLASALPAVSLLLTTSSVAPRAVLRAVRGRGRWIASSAAAVTPVELAERSCSEEPRRFAELREETQQRWPGGAHMVSGAQQGRLLHILVRLSRASRVLEVGCFSGYAALWMALALPPGGALLSLERDERAAEVARRHLDASGVGERVELRVGDAFESLQALHADASRFELVVWDRDGDEARSQGATPPSAAMALRRIAPLLAPHGLLVVRHAPCGAGGDGGEGYSQQVQITDLLAAASGGSPTMGVVTLPSPDGDGGLLSLVGFADGAE